MGLKIEVIAFVMLYIVCYRLAKLDRFVSLL